MSTKFQKGFTLLELLMGVLLIGIAVTIVSMSFNKMNASQALGKSAASAVSLFEEARAKTLSAEGASQYGVRIEDGQLILFRGASYSAADPANVPLTLNSLVGTRNVSLGGGGTSVVFQRLTGATLNSGSFQLYLRAATTTYKTITVSSTGVVEEN
jgi:prepilin-type N-terminal cleavage/methylation domain-containing protein